MRIGVTGHQGLDGDVRSQVEERLRAELERRTPVIGVSALAEGADQLFAAAVLAVGGELIAVIPSADYESSLDASAVEAFRTFINAAAEVVVLPYAAPSEEAFWAAGKEVVERADMLIAVWDGEPARGVGGTADVVAYARTRGKDVVNLWPTGASR